MAFASKRAQRMDRRHKKNKPSALNLISLMDIFTILVFFLLVNSSEVTTLPSTKDVQLPESTAEQLPRETVVVKVTADTILVQGKPIISIAGAMRSNNTVIPALQAALLRAAPKVDAGVEKEITILGDESVRYPVLKKVMASCASADFDRVSLAVMQMAPKAAGKVAT